MDFNYTNSNIDVNDILHKALLITNAFSKTLEDNNCLLILTVGLNQEIDTTIKDLEDLSNSVSETNDILDGVIKENTQDDILNNINSIVDDLKDKCFQCNIKPPSIDFNTNLSFLLGTLKNQIELYKSIFKINKIDLCQPAYSLQNACVPDILKLITLLLTAFVSIMSLKKLSNISVGAFIKGVLSTLLSKITQSLKISVNIGSTNISCLINTLQEIALAIPTQDNIKKKLDTQEKRALGLEDEDGNDTSSNLLRSSMLDSLNKSISSNMNDLSDIDKELDNAEKQLNDSFTLVNKVIESALSEINNYLESLLGFQTFFECETKRSGMDVEEAISKINNLIQVINMLSSLALSLVKKQMREDSCRTESTINSLSEEDIQDLFVKDLIENTNNQIVDIIGSSDSALELIIYEKEPENSLPKLDLLNCSIDDFVIAHTLPSILNTAKNQLKEESTRVSNNITSNNYTFKKPSKDQENLINNIVDLIYIKPDNVESESIESIVEDIINPIGKKGISNTLEEVIRNNTQQKNLSCKSVEDVLDILNSIKR